MDKKKLMVIFLPGLLIAVLGVASVTKAGLSFWDKVALVVGDKLAAKVEAPANQEEEALGGVGETLPTRNLTGLFDQTLLDIDGTDNSRKYARVMMTGNIYESGGSTAASNTFFSVRNTTENTQFLCLGDVGVQLYASSSNALNKAIDVSIVTSSVSGVATDISNEAFTSHYKLLGYRLAANTGVPQSGLNLFSSSTAFQTPNTTQSGCVEWRVNDYLLGVLNPVTESESATSSDISGISSSSFYWVTPRRMATSS